MNESVIVIGGSIIGLCSAHYLQKEGRQFTFIDQSNMDVDASYVNAGYLSPSHLTPLSAAWVMKQSLKWMFNPSNPLYIKPRWDADFLKWTYVFNKSFNLEHAKKAILCIKALAFLRQELYGDIKADQHLAFHYMKEGLYWKIHKMLKLSYCYRSCYDGLEYGHRNW